MTPRRGSSRPGAAALALAIACLVGATHDRASADRVERRGQAAAIEGTVTRVGEDGVEITTALNARHLVPWDRVRAVETDQFSAQLAAMRPVADQIWRARSRVERGDTRLAEPLLERLFERYRGQSNETAAVVAEGLLRCRLARGEQALAVIAVVELARLRRLGVQTDSYSALPPVLDEETLLSPYLPPLLPEGPTLDRLRRESFDGGDPVVRAIALAYMSAPVIRADGRVTDALTLPPLAEVAASHPGAALIDSIVRAASAPISMRAERTAALLAAAERGPEFAVPWIRAMHGLALAADPQPERARRGVVQLLYLPALHARRHPWLAAAALLAAVETESRVGDPSAATTLRRELLSTFPYHPLVAQQLRAPARPLTRTPTRRTDPPEDSS